MVTPSRQAVKLESPFSAEVKKHACGRHKQYRAMRSEIGLKCDSGFYRKRHP